MGESSLMGVRALNSGVGGSSPSPPRVSNEGATPNNMGASKCQF